MNRKLITKNRSNAVNVPVSLSLNASLISIEKMSSPTKSRPETIVDADDDQSRLALFKARPAKIVVKIIGR